MSAASDWLEGAGKAFGRDVLHFFALAGLVLSGPTAAATGWLTLIRQDSFHNDPNLKLTPEQLATALLKNQIGGDFAAEEARYSGLRPESFDILVKSIGNPPGPFDLLRMLNRGQIDPPTAEQGLRESYLRNEWIPAFMQLRHDIMSTQEAVQAAVQGHVSYAIARDAAQLNGTPGDLFDVLFETAGNPPGPTTTLTMMNRGILDEAASVQALRESRLKDKYIPAMLALARRRLPLRSVTQLLNAGAITDQDALDNLRALGYDQADAERIIAGHKAPAKEVVRHLTVTQIKGLLDAGAITQAEAAADLQTLGYSPQDAAAVVSLMVVPPDRRTRQLAITRVRSAYDARRITRTEASNALDQLQVAAGQRDELLAVWDIEQETQVAHLTIAELTGATRAGVFTVDECRARLAARGYAPEDVNALLVVHRVIPGPSSGAP